MKIILRHQVIYQMSPNNKPVTSVKRGSQIRFETCDCFLDKLIKKIPN